MTRKSKASKLKEAEAARRASKEQYRILFDSIDEGFCVIEVFFDGAGRPLDYRFLEINPMFEQQTGLRSALGKTARELVPNLEEHWFETYGRVALTGEPIRFVDGSEAMDRWFDVYAFRVGQPEERKVAILFNDITKRKRAELNARFLLELDREIARQADADGIALMALRRLGCYLGVRGCCLSEIDLAAGLSTVSYEWMSDGRSLAGIYKIADFIRPEFRAFIEAGQGIAINDVRRDERTAAFAANYAAFGTAAFAAAPHLGEGRLEATLSVNTAAPRVWRADELRLLSEVVARIYPAVKRARAEQAVRESEERFAKAFNATPLILAISSLVTGKLLAVNETFTLVTGYTREEAVGRTTAELRLWANPDDRAEELAIVKTRGQVRNAEYRFRARNGKILIGLLSAERIEISGETCALSVIADITERKRAEEAREALLVEEQRLRETAEMHNRAKDDFLAVVTHELRSPLNAILGYARLARSNAHDPEQVARHCDVIERAARTQQQLIDDLLDTARIISGKLRIDAMPCDLRLVLEEALAVVRPAAEARDITLVARFAPLSQPVYADPARLQQVVWNLLQNAVKFTPAGGRVELRMEKADRQARIIVSDTGRGIEPAFLPSIFDRFTQADASRSRRHGGLGLGLALVKQLVELHGGEIEAASEGAGRGATFIVTLPLQAPQVEIPRPVRAIAAEVRMGPGAIPFDELPSLVGLRVLAVDDQEEARHLITAALTELGASVTAVSSGTEALAFLATPPPGAAPDILILDISMPEEDGYAVLRRVRALETARGVPPAAWLPAIALTAHTSRQDRLAALAAGFQMHVCKPVEPAELAVVIAALTRQRRGATLGG